MRRVNGLFSSVVYRLHSPVGGARYLLMCFLRTIYAKKLTFSPNYSSISQSNFSPFFLFKEILLLQFIACF